MMRYMSIGEKGPSTRAIPCGLIAVGLSLVICSAYMQNAYDALSPLWEIVKDLFRDIGIAFIIAGGVTLLFEWKEYQNQIIKCLSNIMIGEEYVDYIDDDQKSKAIDLLHRKLYMMNREEDPNSFFNFVYNKIIPMLTDCYYDDYHVQIECDIDEQTGLIIKRIKKRMVIVNPIEGKTCNFTLPFGATMKIIEGENRELYKVLSCKVSDNSDHLDDRAVEIKRKEIKTDNDGYNISYSGDLVLNISKKTVVETETMTIVPISDKYYTHRIIHPCRNYDITYLISNPSYIVKGHGFNFCSDERFGAGIYKQACSSGVYIKFTDWILSGGGVVITVCPDLKTDPAVQESMPGLKDEEPNPEKTENEITEQLSSIVNS